MLKKSILILLTIFLFFIESVILSRFPWNGVTMPLVLTFGLAVSVASDEWDTIIMALLVGFLVDMYSNHLFGLNMLINLYVFLGLNQVKSYLRQEKNWLMALIMAAAALLRCLVHFGVNYLTGLPQDVRVIPVLTLMVLILGVPTLFLTRKLFIRQQKRTRFI